MVDTGFVSFAIRHSDFVIFSVISASYPTRLDKSCLTEVNGWRMPNAEFDRTGIAVAERRWRVVLQETVLTQGRLPW